MEFHPSPPNARETPFLLFIIVIINRPSLSLSLSLYHFFYHFLYLSFSLSVAQSTRHGRVREKKIGLELSERSIISYCYVTRRREENWQRARNRTNCRYYDRKCASLISPPSVKNRYEWRWHNSSNSSRTRWPLRRHGKMPVSIPEGGDLSAWSFEVSPRSWILLAPSQRGLTTSSSHTSVHTCALSWPRDHRWNSNIGTAIQAR